ncbi:MAG: poly-gamma-glutamate synthase PgsB [Pirellulales bacterium]|nr:poly-gamma-glutamate synthase PgsB [Pirellulales bacterium]
MDPAFLVAGATGLLTGLGLAESWMHSRSLRRIPIRIHVNGTRGKSGVTRLIAAGLRAGGVRTFAKTTGTLARMILPDGSEQPVVRPGRTNVIEQLKVMRTAASYDVDALVVECMAVQPHLQSLCEMKMVQSTHGVITNARPDHLDAMGPTDVDVAKALAGTTPVGGKLFTCEQKHLGILAAAAFDRGSKLVPVGNRDVDEVAAAEMFGFDYIEHQENVALALKVCADLGIDRRTALSGMWNAAPDPGVLSTHALAMQDRDIVFVNGFAANDPLSTEHNWHLALDRFAHMNRRTAIFNCRVDRPDRSIQLAEACVRWKPADHYMLIGTGTNIFAKRALACGLSSRRLTVAEQFRAPEIFDHMLKLSGDSSLVMGMGNIGGPGLDIVQYVCDRSQARQRVGAAEQQLAGAA